MDPSLQNRNKENLANTDSNPTKAAINKEFIHRERSLERHGDSGRPAFSDLWKNQQQDRRESLTGYEKQEDKATNENEKAIGVPGSKPETLRTKTTTKTLFYSPRILQKAGIKKSTLPQSTRTPFVHDQRGIKTKSHLPPASNRKYAKEKTPTQLLTQRIRESAKNQARNEIGRSIDKQSVANGVPVQAQTVLNENSHKSTGAIRKDMSRLREKEASVSPISQDVETIKSAHLNPRCSILTSNIVIKTPNQEADNTKPNGIKANPTNKCEALLDFPRNVMKHLYANQNHLEAPKHNSRISESPQPPVNVIINRFNQEHKIDKCPDLPLVDKVIEPSTERISYDFINTTHICSSTKYNRESGLINSHLENSQMIAKEINKKRTRLFSEDTTDAAERFLQENFMAENVASTDAVKSADIKEEQHVSWDNSVIPCTELVLPGTALNYSSLNVLDSAFINAQDFFDATDYPQSCDAASLKQQIMTQHMISPIKANIYTSNTTLISTSTMATPKKKTLSSKNLSTSRIYSENNPFTCDIYQSIYRTDIIQYLLSHDTDYVLTRTFLNCYNPDTDKRRKILNWIIKRQDVLHLNDSMFLMTVRLFDNILAKTTIPINMYQLVILANVWIITKCQSPVILSAPKLLKLCDNVYSRRQLLRMEMKLLKLFNFNLGINDPTTFAANLLKELYVSEENEITHCVYYILETFSLSPRFSTFPPSELAASAVYLSFKILHPDSTVYKGLVLSDGYYDPKDFKDLVELMVLELEKVNDPDSDVAETFLKYGTLGKKKVSLLVHRKVNRHNHTLCLN